MKLTKEIVLLAVTVACIFKYGSPEDVISAADKIADATIKKGESL